MLFSEIIYIFTETKGTGKRQDDIVWLPIGDEQTIYTIRKIFKDEENTTLASLEEGVIGYTDDDKELGIPLRLLIEVQPPVDLTQIFSNDKMSL